MNILEEEQGSRVCEQQTSLQMNGIRKHQSGSQLEASDTAHGESAIYQGSRLIQTASINTYIITITALITP